MGTSGAYEGSGGGGWSSFRGETGNLRPGANDDAIADAVAIGVGAIGWGPGDGEGQVSIEEPPAEGPDAGDGSPATVQPDDNESLLIPHFFRRPSRSRGGEASAGVTETGRRGTGPTRQTGSRRSRTRAAYTGARAVSAGLGVVRGDSALLLQLGLDFATLQGLDVFEQCNKILATFEGAASIEDAELRRAATRTILTILEAGAEIDAEGAVRTFLAEYVFQVLATEMGRGLRSRRGNGAASVALEKRIRDYIRAITLTMPLPTVPNTGSVQLSTLETCIESALADVRDVFAEARVG